MAASLLISLAAFGAEVRPLYTGNQNTKFLHAFAQAGVGFLRDDWTAQTKDGLPVFTAIVKAILISIGEPGFYIAAFATYFGFGICAVLLHLILTRGQPYRQWHLLIFTALVCVTVAIPDVKRIVLDGLGGQYILRGYFQPSDFGVLLIFSILCFAMSRVALATVCAVIAALLHPGYVAPAAVILSIYLVFEVWVEDKARRSDWSINFGAVVLGLAALLANALVIQNLFPPSSAEAYHEAHRLLVETRIPHHSNPWAWNANNTFVKAAICGVAIGVLPRGRLLFVITALSLATVVLVLVGLLPDLTTYKLVAPWRLSVALIPLAALVCLWALATKITFFLTQIRTDASWPVSLIGTSIIAATLISGAIKSTHSFSRPSPGYRDFVRDHLEAGQLYLTAPWNTKFRLLTGAPQYISYKTHPYLDLEVLEWDRRLQRARAVFRGRTFDCQELRQLAIQEGVTHVLTKRRRVNASCEFARPVFQEGWIVILELDVRDH
jgi:hypothetical protein